MKKVKKWSPRNLLLAEFSLAELGGTPLPPLTENHPAQKPLAEKIGKNPLSSFDRFPYSYLRNCICTLSEGMVL